MELEELIVEIVIGLFLLFISYQIGHLRQDRRGQFHVCRACLQPPCRL